MARMINIGFGNTVNADKIVAVIRPDAAPIKRMVQSAKENGTCIDATQGRRTKSVIISEENFIILSALQNDTINRRINAEISNEDKGEHDET